MVEGPKALVWREFSVWVGSARLGSGGGKHVRVQKMTSRIVRAGVGLGGLSSSAHGFRVFFCFCFVGYGDDPLPEIVDVQVERAVLIEMFTC